MLKSILDNSYSSILERCDQLVNSYTLEFTLSDLIDDEDFIANGRYSKNFKGFFKDLDTIESDCIYVFRLSSDDSLVDELLNTVAKYKDTIQGFPPLNASYKKNTLYVGKRQSRAINQKKNLSYISSRIIAHLGYYDKVGGLKLKQWGKEFSQLKITLEIYDLGVESTTLEEKKALSIIESLVAFELKPILGFH